MCDGDVLMVGTVPSMGISAALCSFPLVLFRSEDCQTPEKRQVCKWCGGSLEAHGETGVVPANTYKHAELILGGLMADASLAKL